MQQGGSLTFDLCQANPRLLAGPEDIGRGRSRAAQVMVADWWNGSEKEMKKMAAVSRRGQRVKINHLNAALIRRVPTFVGGLISSQV